MLEVRTEQMKVFEEAAMRRFEDEMVEHLAKFSPPLFKAAGEDQLRKTIRLGTSRAAAYGLTNRGPVRLYLELMLLFGSYFDTDPQYTWSAEILKKRESAPQMDRADMLYKRTQDYRQKVGGTNDAYTLEALRNISVLAAKPMQVASENFVSAMLGEISRIYPQKAAYVGSKALELLIHEGINGARAHRFPAPRGAVLFVVLMLAFGHGCADDPLYPWINRTLKDEAIADPEARAKRLESKAVTWLNHVLAYFDEGSKQ